jgi:leader peptidase (prepilin peptidase) / N-methyltransferase
VNILLVSGTTVAGLVIGGVLDPVGQRLADRSRQEDERRRAEERAADDESGPEADDPPGAGSEPIEAPVRHVLPAGPAPGRTIAAAVVTGALFGAAAHHFGPDLVLAPFCVFFAMLVVVSVTDLTHRLVPRRLLYGALALIVPLLVASAAVDHQWRNVSGAAIAGAVSFGLFFAVWWFVPRGLGFGDVRLAGVIGITVGYLSLLHAYVAFLAGFVIGLLFGVVLMVGTSSGRKTRIPFAPSLALGAVIAVFWGGHVAHTFFHAGTG